jgi:hypothetical protein
MMRAGGGVIDQRKHLANGRLRMLRNLLEIPDQRSRNARGVQFFNPRRRWPLPKEIL